MPVDNDGGRASSGQMQLNLGPRWGNAGTDRSGGITLHHISTRYMRSTRVVYASVNLPSISKQLMVDDALELHTRSTGGPDVTVLRCLLDAVILP